MKRAGRVLLLFMVIIGFAGACQTKNVEAADMENVKEQDGTIVNISMAFHHERYVNGYYLSNIILYMEGENTYFAMTVTNMTSAAREEVEVDCLMYDGAYLELASVGSRIPALPSGASAQAVAVMDGSGMSVGAYDFVVLFAEGDLLDFAKDAAINEEIISDVNEVERGDDMVLQSREEGEYATYQWFYAEGMSDTGMPIAGADSRVYKIDNAAEEAGRYYYCKIWKEDRIVNSKRIKVIVYDNRNIQGISAPSGLDTNVCQVKGLAVKQLDKPGAKLTWKKCHTEKIVILRSVKKTAGYQVLKKLKGNRTGYTDKTVKRGGVYYYKVISFGGEVTEEVFLCRAKVKKIKIAYLMQPAITVTKGITGGQRYVQIILKEFEGEYIEIYLEGKSGCSKLRIEKGKNRTSRKKYRFRYGKGNARLVFRARTYRMAGGKKYYSSFSRIARIRI